MKFSNKYFGILLGVSFGGMMLLGAYNSFDVKASSSKKVDKTVMTINGKNVDLAEFEYLYNKNKSQQASPQTLDEYIKMFVDYKLKVADAEACGLDTTETFITEFSQFRDELAAPYLKSKEAEDSLVDVAYKHYLKEVEASHIMFPAPPDDEDFNHHYLIADSVLKEIKAGNITFDEAASVFSIDGYTGKDGGHLGKIQPGKFPWLFEDAVFSMKQGEIGGIVNSGVGLHIVRIDSVYDGDGQVLVQHILKITRDKSPERVAQCKAEIDSIHVLLNKGGDFDMIAMAESEDPGSAQNGGRLPWFGRGVMVQPFEEIAFSLESSLISEPFESPFGYHIIKKLDDRPYMPFNEAQPEILAQINSDSRARIPIERKLEDFATLYNARILTDGFPAIIENAGAVMSDDVVLGTPVFEIDGNVTPIGDIAAVAFINSLAGVSEQTAMKQLSQRVKDAYNKALTERARRQLYEDNEDYRNLVNEYRDGILLFDVSNKNVWEKASSDVDGLEAFFKANRSKYEWGTEKYKGFIFFAHSDSLMNAALDYAAGIVNSIKPSQLAEEIHKKFERKVRVERVIAGKGDNVISDYLIYGGPKPEPTVSRWPIYRAFGGRIIPAPEEAADVKNAVVTDYQQLLEQQWIKSLHDKYPVKVNEKLIKKRFGK